MTRAYVKKEVLENFQKEKKKKREEKKNEKTKTDLHQL